MQFYLSSNTIFFFVDYSVLKLYSVLMYYLVSSSKIKRKWENFCEKQKFKKSSIMFTKIERANMNQFMKWSVNTQTFY